MDQGRRTAVQNATRIRQNPLWAAEFIFANYEWITLEVQIVYAIKVIRVIYFPILAMVAFPVNLVTILILFRGKCGVTRYLVAMAAADLLVVVLDLILSKIPNSYAPYDVYFWSLSIPVCNIHVVLLHIATDCSVWFTVAFTFDRFVAICCQKLKTTYCTRKTAALILGSVTVISCLRNIYWYFRLSGYYALMIATNICFIYGLLGLRLIDFFNYILTPVIPFLLVLLTNALTARYVLVTSRGRRRLRCADKGKGDRDPEMESRRKSLVLLLIISGNFVLLWAPFTVYSAWIPFLSYSTSISPPEILRDLGSMLQLLSCCTNTALYAITQTKFREQLRAVIKYPLALSIARIRR